MSQIGASPLHQAHAIQPPTSTNGKAATHFNVLQVHLTVDTTLQDNKLAINTYVARVLSLGNRSLANEFQAVDYEVLGADLERVGGVYHLDLVLCSLCLLPNEHVAAKDALISHVGQTA